MNYLSERIGELEGKLSTLDFLIEEKIEGIVIELVKIEAEELKTEIELLNNILNFITIKALSEPVEEMKSYSRADSLEELAKALGLEGELDEHENNIEAAVKLLTDTSRNQ